jgi:hypothetical protein
MSLKYYMTITCINIFQSKALQNFTKIGILGFKTNHLATLLPSLVISQPVPTFSAEMKFCEIRNFEDELHSNLGRVLGRRWRSRRG